MKRENAIRELKIFSGTTRIRLSANFWEALNTAINALEQDWIPCSKRLPEEKINPITQDFYEYQCTFKNKDVYDVRTYKFGKSHWWHGLSIMDNYVIAWRESPEPYKTKDGEEE